MGMKSRSSPGGGGMNEITMTDTKGKEMLNIHAQYDMVTTVEHDSTTTVKNNMSTTVKVDDTQTVTGKRTIDVTGTHTEHVKAAVAENYDDTQATTVKGDITIKSTGGAIAILGDAKHVFIQAATNIQLHVGDSMIWMDKGGQINIKGNDVAINGANSVTIKGLNVTSHADAQHKTEGALVISEGSVTNTVKGGMVMLNP
jgi:type VI secretion system secreted protein VgrG